MSQYKKSHASQAQSTTPTSPREEQLVSYVKPSVQPSFVLPSRKESQTRRYMWYGWMLILFLGLGYLFLAPKTNESPVLAKYGKFSPQSSQLDTLMSISRPVSDEPVSEELEISSKATKSAVASELIMPSPSAESVVVPTHVNEATHINETTHVNEATTSSSTNKALPTAKPTATPTKELVTHEVASGEMPLSIAVSYGISVEELLVANDDFDPTLLQIGQALIIPITVTPTPTSTPTPKESPTPTATPQVYIVEAGDSPLSIALKHDTTSEAIMWVNKILNPSGLQVGQELVIPQGDDLSEIASSSQTALHTIRSGDTLLVFANNYGSTVDDILESNPELDPTNLSLDQQIIIPLTNPRFDSTAYTPSAAPIVLIPDPPAPGLVGLQQQMILAVNAHREAHGFVSYIADESLNQIAMARAQDMDKRGYFSHVSPEGQRVRDYVRNQGLIYTWVGENIERNTQPEASTVNHSVTWFMGHPPHRHNILHPNYTRIGVGVSNQHHFYTFVLVFAGD
ncbi:LysM peptidoglycan-binding domain-containing protein [Anaerolineales bacterium HSG24]|nr:LysM peptidoglycan-binding domain-containing protein [Anaerolineales bacterium HSG24]